MKKIFSSFLVLVMLLSLVPTYAFAASDSLAVGVSNGEVTLTYTVPNKTTTVGAISLKIAFDGTKLTPTAVNAHSFSNASPTTSNASEAAASGKVASVWVNEDNEIEIPAGTVLLTATFAIEDGASGTAEFTVEQISITGGEIGVTKLNGTAGVTTTPKTVTIPKAPITSAYAHVSEPVKGEPLDTTVDIGGATTYTATVAWYEGTSATGTPVTGNAKANQVYTRRNLP